MPGVGSPRMLDVLARPKSRRALLASALLLQAIVLGVGWFATFRIVQRSFAGVVEDIVQEQNVDIARRVADLLPETMGDVEFGSEEWERLQRIIEGESLQALPAGGFICLVEPDGRLLCHPEIRDNPGLRNFSFDGMELSAGLTGSGSSMPLLDAGSMDAPTTGTIDFPGDTHFVGTQPINNDGLRLLVHQPVGAVVDAGRSSTRWVLAFAGVAAVGVLAISGLGLNALMRRYEGAQERLNRQMRDNLRIAQRIQQATLPDTLPTMDGYSFAGVSLPAEETGGDTFDLARSDDGTHVALTIADATGHGIGPALAVSQLQAMAKLAWRHERDPHRIITVLNEHMHASLPDGRFVTAWLGVLDAARGVIRMVSAGQDPQLVYRAETGQVERLSTDTLPLGIMAELPEYEHRTVMLQKGDILLVATDGIAEAAGPTGEQFGVERVIESLRRLAEQGPQAVIDGVLESVRTFSEDAAPDDDRTLIVVQRRPGAAPMRG